MNRSTQRKLSRALIGGLGLTIALGGVFWLGKIVGSNSSTAQARAERGETTEAVIQAKSAADHSTASAGSANNAATPTTKPASAASASAPGRRPAAACSPPPPRAMPHPSRGRA